MRTWRASWVDIPISEQPRDILTGLHQMTMKLLIKPLITAFQPISTKNYAMKKPRNPHHYEVSREQVMGRRNLKWVHSAIHTDSAISIACSLLNSFAERLKI